MLALALRHLWREKYNAKWKLLALTLWLAVFAVTSLIVLSEVLNSTMAKDSAALLGADLIVESSYIIPNELKEKARDTHLQATSLVEFFSMVSKGDKYQLANISAMDNTYPLKGQLIISNNGGEAKQKAPPSSGEIWMDESLALILNVTLNDLATLGRSQFKVTALIKEHPFSGSGSSILEPLAYINAKDLEAMGGLVPGSRATYQLHLAGDAQKISEYINFYKNNSNKNNDFRWVTPQKGREALNNTIKTTQRYVSLILLIQILLAGIATAMCSHQYALGQQRSVALWRTLGANNTRIISTQLLSLLLLALITMCVSILFAYLFAYWVIHLGNFGTAPFTMKGAALGITTGGILLIGFATPPLLALKRISPLQIIQNTQPLTSLTSMASYILTVMCLCLLWFFYIGETDIAIRLAAQVLSLSIIFFIMAQGFWLLLRRWGNKGSLAWRFGVSYLVRHSTNAITQWIVFTIVLMLLLLVQIIQNDFIRLWQSSLPSSTPNYFLLNIQPDQMASIETWFNQHDFEKPVFYPIVRARMIGGSRGIQRSLNLTWMKDLPLDNKVTAGKSWQELPQGEPNISIEQEFSERQSLEIGDVLRFQIAEKMFTGQIAQKRTVQWSSFKPNFFIVFPPGVLEKYPHTYITSIHIPSVEKKWIAEFMNVFPQTTVIDIDAIIQKIREVMNHLSLALNSLLVIVFLFGIMILYASLLSNLKDRYQESAMLRILGAKRNLIGKILVIEFLTLGFMSGIAASIGAMITAKMLANAFFGLSYAFNLKWLMIGSVSGPLILLVFGLLGTRSVFRASPLWLLRSLE